jgi:hypothetical protein
MVFEVFRGSGCLTTRRYSNATRRTTNIGSSFLARL